MLPVAVYYYEWSKALSFKGTPRFGWFMRICCCAPSADTTNRYKNALVLARLRSEMEGPQGVMTPIDRNSVNPMIPGGVPLSSLQQQQMGMGFGTSGATAAPKSGNLERYEVTFDTQVLGLSIGVQYGLHNLPSVGNPVPGKPRPLPGDAIEAVNGTMLTVGTPLSGLSWVKAVYDFQFGRYSGPAAEFVAIVKSSGRPLTIRFIASSAASSSAKFRAGLHSNYNPETDKLTDKQQEMLQQQQQRPAIIQPSVVQVVVQQPPRPPAVEAFVIQEPVAVLQPTIAGSGFCANCGANFAGAPGGRFCTSCGQERPALVNTTTRV